MTTQRNRPPGTPEELARSLIASARLDVQPAPETVRDGILLSIGSVGALGGGSAVAGVTLSALRRLGLVKWLATTAILGTTGIGVYTVVNRTRSSTANTGHAHETEPVVARGNEAPIAAPPATAASPTPELPAQDTPEIGLSSPALPAPSHRAAASNTASADKSNAPEGPSLEGEVAALDLARNVLAGGDAARTLGLLDQYEQAFPKGALRPEATYLRIQALSRAGQREAARSLAARFLAHHPKSPHAAQLQALLSP